MNKILAAFAAVLLLATQTFAGTIKEDIINPVVKIDEQCSASFIEVKKELFLLTAAHCTTSGGEGFVVTEVRSNDDDKMISYKKVFYDTVRFDKTIDLALLKVRDPDYLAPTVIVADKLLVDEGDAVWTVGYPLGFTRTITVGMFNGKQTAKFLGGNEELTLYRASSNLDGGNSGGMLAQYNKETDTYELIGVTSMKFNKNEFMGLYVTLKNIRKFLRLDLDKSSSTLIDLR